MLYKTILFQYTIVLSTRDLDRGYGKAATLGFLHVLIEFIFWENK